MPIHYQDIPIDNGDGEDAEIQQSAIEAESSYIQRLSQGRSELQAKEKEILRTELSILLDERHANYVQSHIAPSNLQDKAVYIGDYMTLNENYLVAAMQKRLASKGVMLTPLSIRYYLRRISQVFKAALALGKEISALPYADEITRKKRGRPKQIKPRKQGRKRPVVVNGKEYESIEAANRETGYGRRYIQYNADKNSII
jgi:integrase